MKRKLLIGALVVLALLVLGAFGILWPVYQRIHLEARYHSTQRGMSRDEVRARMAHREEAAQVPWRDFWDDNPLPEAESRRITSSLRYSVPTIPVKRTFEFTFDADGRLVGRHIYD
jgi:hypothetical protein